MTQQIPVCLKVVTEVRDSLILGRVESEVIMHLVRLMLGYAAITS